LLPFAVPGAGVPAVLSMGGNKYTDAKQAGATEGEALIAGGVATAAGASAPFAGRAAAPLAERVAAPIADAAGVIPGALTKGAIEGVPQGVVLTGGDAAATAAYDPQAALEELKTIPEAGLEMAIINAIAHGIPAAAITASMRGRALPPVDPRTPDMQHGAPLEPVAPEAKVATTGENAPSQRTAEPSAEEAVSNKTANASTPAKPGLFDDINLGAQEAPTHVETNEAPVLPRAIAEKLRAEGRSDLRRTGRPETDAARDLPGSPAENESAPRPILDAKGHADVPAPAKAVRPGVRREDIRSEESAPAERGGEPAPVRTGDDAGVRGAHPAAEESRAPERGRVQERVAEPVDAGRGTERVGSSVARGDAGRGEPRPNRDELRSEDAPVRAGAEDHPAAQRGDDRSTYDNFLARLSDNDAKRLRTAGREARQSKDPAKKRAYLDLKRSLGWTDEHDRQQTNRRRGVDDGQKSVFDEEVPNVPIRSREADAARPQEDGQEAHRSEGQKEGRQEAVPVREVAGREAAPAEGAAPVEAARPSDSGGERASRDRGVPDRDYSVAAVRTRTIERLTAKVKNRTATEDDRRILYGARMEEAAAKRAEVQGDSLKTVEGGLTGNELATKRQKADNFHVGREVVVDGKPGTIERRPAFGMAKVKFADGTSKSVGLEYIQKKPLKFSARAFRPLDNTAGEHEGVLHVTAETARNLKRVPDAELTSEQAAVRKAFRHASVEFSDQIDSRADALYYKDEKGRHVVIRGDASPKDYRRLVGHELTHAMLEGMDGYDRSEFLDMMRHTLQEQGTWDKAIEARERWGDKPEARPRRGNRGRVRRRLHGQPRARCARSRSASQRCSRRSWRRSTAWCAA
jgi:hypothetical protein